MKIAVLRGGRSAEREGSLHSGARVEEALRGRGHDVTGIDLDMSTWDVLRDGDFACVFNALHVRLGEDGSAQWMLGVLALPYTGSATQRVRPRREMVAASTVYDYDAKYAAGKSHHIIPARISEAARAAASEAAGRAFTVLGCSGMGRVDIIVDADGTPWLLELNTVPGLTALSLLPDAARAAGITFDDLCQRLVHPAIAPHQHHVGPLAD